MALEPGTQVARYRIVRLIAQGGMAEVYRAEQELAGGFTRAVALKVIRPEYAESPDFREMFLDEARTACTLSHPNIVPIYEVGEAEGLLFMAMELVVGETLAAVNRLLRERGERLSDEAILAVGIYTCSALEAVHALKLPGEGHVNLVHRDVSPHNLLLSPNGSLKLIDFGIAKASTNRNLTSVGITKGKAGYFSPEQAMGKPLDGRSDLFSLGVTLYKLASGQTPFDEHRTHTARNSALVAGRWENLREVCQGLPEGMYHVVDKSLMLKPEARFSNAREMREALEQVALESGVHVGPSSLSGYVEVDDEAIAVGKIGDSPPPGSGARLGAGPQPRTGGFSAYRGKAASGPTKTVEAPNPSLRHHTERVQPSAARPGVGKYVLYGALGLSAVVLGAIVVLLFARPKDVAVQPKVEPVKVAQVTPPKVDHPLPIADPLAAAKTEPQPLKIEPAKTDAEKTEKTVAAVVHEKKTHKETKVASAAEEKAPPEEVIPDGMGTLRISTNPPDASVFILGANKGTTPLNMYRVKSGKYLVEMVASNKARASCAVKVLPDKTTRLIYDFSDKHCAADGP